MRRLVLAAAVAACGEGKPVTVPVPSGGDAGLPPVPASASASASASAPASARPGTPSRPLAKEGAMCGGIAGIACADGLTCKMVGPMHPDKSGTCSK